MIESTENRSHGSDIMKTVAECLNYGVIYVEEDGRIGEYSPRAKEMMGVTLPEGESHPEGELTSGYIVFASMTHVTYDLTNLWKWEAELTAVHMWNWEIREFHIAWFPLKA